MNRIISNKGWALTSIVLMIALNMSLKAQSSFITEVDISVSELTSTQNVKYQRILNQETVVSTKFIDLANLSEVQEGGWLILNIPDKGCIAQVKAKYVSSYESGDYYWYGEVINEGGETEEDCECYEGFVNLMRYNGEMIGTISLDEDRYEIQSLGEGRTVLVKKDVTHLSLGCGNDDSEGLTGGSEQTITPRSNGNCPVRVLALFTPNGNDAVVNIQNTINLSIAETNQALRNSQVLECDLELILVDVQEIQFGEGNNARDDRDDLIDDANVQLLRDNADADIVVVYTDGNYGSVIGIAGTLTLQQERALCVIEAAEATTEFNTAHEIAHLFACRHEPEADPTGPIEHAHDFKTGCWPFRKERNTVMFSVATGRTIQHYSNPNVEFKKKKTGVSDEKENWRQLKANACTVANFQDDDVVPLLNANITGEFYACPCGAAQLEADISGGVPGPYQVEWRISNDGFNYGPVVSAQNSYFLPVTCEEGSFKFVWLRVESLDGQVSQSFAQVVVDEKACGVNGLLQQTNNGINTKFEQVNIYPNPATNHLILEYWKGNEENFTFSILDIYGRKMERSEVSISKGKNQIDIHDLPSGLYFLRINNEAIGSFVKASN